MTSNDDQIDEMPPLNPGTQGTNIVPEGRGHDDTVVLATGHQPLLRDTRPTTEEFLSLNEIMTKFNDPNQERNLNDDEKRRLLLSAYKLIQPMQFTNDQLKSISDIVNNHVVSKVKFVPNEFLRLKTKEEKRQVQKFPSFWEPDLIGEKKNIAKDVLSKIPELKGKSIIVWAATWMGISKKVLEKIRYNRNSLHNYLKPVVLNGTCQMTFCVDDYIH